MYFAFLPAPRFNRRRVPGASVLSTEFMSVVRTIIPDVEPKAEMMPDSLRAAGVTRRELETFWLVADRLHNKEIAERLHVSARTVESHVSSLLGKLGAPDRQDLIETAALLSARIRDRS